jgi:hypothetical protein
MSFVRVIALGCLAILVFDAAAALAAEALDFSYSALWPVSFLIYAVTAFTAARVARSAAVGALTGLTVAATDATLGWALSSAIGPGKPEDDTALAIAVTVVAVSASGAVVGLIAGFAGQRRPRTT